MRPLIIVALLLGFTASLNSNSAADQIALDFTGGIPFLPADEANNAPYTIGWSFTTSQAFAVSGLGFWDGGDHTLGFSHEVGLWNASQNLLASTTITAASTPVASTGPGQWLFNTVTSVILAPGTYYLGATYLSTDNLDEYRYNTTVTTITGLTFDSGQYVLHSSGLTFPATTEGDPGTYMGPNIEFSAVPEPASAVLLAMGAVGLLLRRKKRSYSA